MFTILVLFSLAAFAQAVNTRVVASPGSSLSTNNPVVQAVVLCSTLFSTLVGGQRFTNNDESEQEFENTIVTGIALDDDDNDFGNRRNIADEFETSPQGFIQFEPRTYASIVGVAVVITLLGLWAAFDFNGGRLTPARLAAIRARVNANGGFLPYLIWIGPAMMSAVLMFLQLAFLVIATIYVVQPMLQWAVIENPNGTQSVIAEEGLFAVTVSGTAALASVTAVPVVRTNFAPFFFPLVAIGNFGGGGGGGGGGVAFPPTGAVPFESPTSELVLSPTPISIANTWYVYIVFFVLLAQFFVAMGMALIWRGGQYIAGAVAIFVGWALDIALLVFIILELSDLNPGQAAGEEIAMLVFAIVAVLLLISVLAFAIGIATVLRQGEFAAILNMNDEELAAITPTQEKRRLN